MSSGENVSYPPFVETVVRRPWPAILLLFGFALICGLGGSRLTISNDIEVFFGEGDPKLKDLRELEDAFGDSQSILFVLSPEDGTVFTEQTLKAIAQLTERAWELPYARRVDSISNFQHTFSEEDDLVVIDLVEDPEALDSETIAKIRETALAEPLLINRLLSPSGHVTGVNVPLQLPNKEPLVETPTAANAARALAAEIADAYPGLTIRLTGVIMLNASLAEVAEADIATLMPVMLIVVLLLLGIIQRSFASVASTFVVIIASIVVGLGLAGWLGIVISPPCISAANIIMTLAIADSVHVLSSFFHYFRLGHSKQEALLESLRVNYRPVLITSATTLLGFLTMNASESPPFRDLGNIVALGVLGAWLYAVYFLPAMLAVLPIKPGKARDPKDKGLYVRLANWIIAKRQILLPAGLIVVLVLIVFIPRNQLNDEFLKYFSTDVPFRQHADYAIENLTGFEYVEYQFDSGEEGGISEPAYLKALEAFADWLRLQPKVRHVAAYTDVIKRLNKNLHGDEEDWFRTPENRELAAQCLLLYEMSLPAGLDLTDQITIDKSASLVRISLDSITSNEMRDLESRAAIWMQENVPTYAANRATGQPLVFAHIGRRNITSLLATSVAALFVISLLLGFTFKSWKYGLVSLIPNLAPAAMAYGLWGLLVGRVGLALAVVVGMTLGIVVDDTVHFVSKYLLARREGKSSEDSVCYAVQHTGQAISVTSVILIAGFLILTLSNFELNSGMGLLSAVTIVFAWLADLLLLPPILMLLDRRKEKT